MLTAKDTTYNTENVFQSQHEDIEATRQVDELIAEQAVQCASVEQAVPH